MKTYKIDAASETGIFFQSQLTAIESKFYNVKYPEHTLLNLLTVDSSAHEGAETVRYLQYDVKGEAKILATMADDIPMIDLSGKAFDQKVITIADSFGYSSHDIRAAEMASLYNQRMGGEALNLNDEKALQAKKNIDARIEKLLWMGDAANGIAGILGTNANSDLVTDTVKNSTAWASATAAEILDDLYDIANQTIVATNGIESGPNTIILPPAQYAKISSTNYSTVNGMTILEQFLQNNAVNVTKVLRSPFLSATFNSGITYDTAVALNTDPSLVKISIPMPVVVHPVQEKNLMYISICETRTAGLLIPYPKTIAVVTGLTA